MRWAQSSVFTFALYLFLIVITDPYAGIDYEEVQVYHIKHHYKPLKIKVYCAEGHSDCYNEKGSDVSYEEEEYSEPIQSIPKRYFCYMCNPMRWLYE